jgi:putative ABC transport system ATP-binding protein
MTVSPELESRRLAVCVDGVTKTYGQGEAAAQVLYGVDLHVERGRSVFLAGPSGSGKSTLLSILGCILSPDQGHVEILGQDLAALDSQQRTLLRRDRIGFVFQRFHLIHGLTACENVGVPLLLRGISSDKVRLRALELLEAVGLFDHANVHPRKLSAGQCQRVALARALANDPDLILADEPTAALDAANGHEMMELLWRLTTQRGKTAIVVTHDSRIFCFADHIYWLENGRVVERQNLAASADGHPLPAGPGPVFVPDLPIAYPSLMEAGR